MVTRFLGFGFASSFRKMSPHRPEHLILTAKHTRKSEILDATIENIQDLSPTVKGFQLRVPKGKSFLAGQWVDFFIPNMETVGGFSMCCPPSTLERNSMLELAVKQSEWPPANWLHTEAQKGQAVSLRIGGDFHYPMADMEKADHELLLIAGGVGINPLASIYFHVADLIASGKSNCKKVHLLFSAKSTTEHLFKLKFDSVSELHPEVFTNEYISTRDTGKKIDLQKLQEAVMLLNGPKKRTFCFVCGPPQMIKDVTKLIGSLGIPESNIKYELWW